MKPAAPSSNPMVRFLRRTLGPLALIVVCPPAAIVFWHICVAQGGSLSSFLTACSADGLWATVWAAWEPVFFGTPEAWTIIGLFAASQLVLMRVLPGKEFRGPLTPGGHVPVYKANGPLSFAVTLLLFGVLSVGLDLFSPAIVYTHLGAIIGALNIFSLAFCLFLYLKGRFAPSGPDHSHTGNFIFDYYWGTELYPRVLGWDVKQFTNCRFGMMGWAVMIVSYAAAQYEMTGAVSDSMMVSVGIQLVYIGKFFWWETGYLASLDIMHDRAGFYICWGCLVWVPAIYTSPSMYLVEHPNELGVPLALLIFGLGVFAVFTNYFADRQRQQVRATNGNCKVWGKPPELIHARYTTAEGVEKQSLLLASGWWGVSRHFHYVPEIAGAFFWTVPALFDNALPYFYVVFLTILLTDRAFRDEKRCAAKYGDYWRQYCERVRYRIVPGLL